MESGFPGLYRDVFGFEYTRRNVILLLFLVLLPNLLGMLNYTTLLGLRFHFFQYGIFLAALTYGRWGGLLAGCLGSAYVAASLGNPYVIIGNMILGYFTGYFSGCGLNPMKSSMAAFVLQLPWLVVSDIYLAGMGAYAVLLVVLSLALSNLVFSAFAGFSAILVRRWIR